MGLTVEQRATNFETLQHIMRVRDILDAFAQQLLSRGAVHDQSKLQSPEVELFTEWTPKLAATTFGSAEYENLRKQLGPALAHHYVKNRHHPEHFSEGVDGMNLVDLVEMFCDWKAATERHHDGNLRYSVEKNAVRFNLSSQLERILANTIDLFDGGK